MAASNDHLNLPYYHGLLSRADIKDFLKQNGDFVVRTTEPLSPGERQLVISVMLDSTKEEAGIKHYVIRVTTAKTYCIDKYGFESVHALIVHHLTNKESISNKDPNAVIKNPIGRQGWELIHPDIEPTKKLGEGAYGEVHMGKLKVKAGNKVNVAIKMAKLEALTKEQIKEVMREARIMRLFDHPHVVKFYGVAAGTEPLMVVMELADNGSLDSFLSKNTTLSPEKRVEMCCQAAWGVEYLHNKVYIHRDLAARNCLYGDGKVKISDFGLTREGISYTMNPHKRVPIRWLAPEVLKTFTYCVQSDVWAFGIMCWEIFAGQEPYPGMMVAEVSNQVRQGYRMTFPENTPPEFSNLIANRCWTENAIERATMSEITFKLETMLGLPKPQAGPGFQFCQPTQNLAEIFIAESKNKQGHGHQQNHEQNGHNQTGQGHGHHQYSFQSDQQNTCQNRSKKIKHKKKKKDL